MPECKIERLSVFVSKALHVGQTQTSTLKIEGLVPGTRALYGCQLRGITVEICLECKSLDLNVRQAKNDEGSTVLRDPLVRFQHTEPISTS